VYWEKVNVAFTFSILKNDKALHMKEFLPALLIMVISKHLYIKADF